MGVLSSCFNAGTALFTALYGLIFATGHLTDEAHQDLGGFYLMNAISFAVTCFLGVLFLKQYPPNSDDAVASNDIDVTISTDMSNEIKLTESPDEQRKDQNISTITDVGNKDIPDKSPFKEKNITGLKLLKRFDFHFFLWGYFFCSGLQIVLFNNQQTYLKSYSLEEYTTLFTVMIPVAGIAAELVSGFVSDLILHRVPRIGVVLVLNIPQTLFLGLSIFLSDNLIVFAATNLFTGFANGALWALMPAMVVEYFGPKYFSRNWGAILLGNAFSGLALSEIFGWIYKNNITDPDSFDCYGLHCFTWSFIMLTVLSVDSIILNVGLLRRTMEQNTQQKGQE